MRRRPIGPGLGRLQHNSSQRDEHRAKRSADVHAVWHNLVIGSNDIEPRSVCIEQVRRALIRGTGTVRLEAWLGKDGIVTYDVAELAAIAVEALAPLLDEATAADRVMQLYDRGVLSPPLHVDPNDW